MRVRHMMQPDFDRIDGLATVTDALKQMKYVETRTLLLDKRHEDDE